jgi:hypothetical protein
VTTLLGPDGQEIGKVTDLREDVGLFVKEYEAVLTETELRYAGKSGPPRPSQRAERHRRENAAARAKKRRRKQSRR